MLPVTAAVPSDVPEFRQMDLSETVVAAGTGFTVIVKVLAVPVVLTPPLTNIGVTVIVAVSADAPELTAVKAGMFPLPKAASPIEVLLLLQAKVVVPLVLTVAKVTAAEAEPLHRIFF